MSKCVQCGINRQDTSVPCRICGYPDVLATQPHLITGEKTPCPYCRELIASDATKCRFCHEYIRAHESKSKIIGSFFAPLNGKHVVGFCRRLRSAINRPLSQKKFTGYSCKRSNSFVDKITRSDLIPAKNRQSPPRIVVDWFLLAFVVFTIRLAPRIYMDWDYTFGLRKLFYSYALAACFALFVLVIPAIVYIVYFLWRRHNGMQDHNLSVLAVGLLWIPIYCSGASISSRGFGSSLYSGIFEVLPTFAITSIITLIVFYRMRNVVPRRYFLIFSSALMVVWVNASWFNPFSSL